MGAAGGRLQSGQQLHNGVVGKLGLAQSFPGFGAGGTAKPLVAGGIKHAAQNFGPVGAGSVEQAGKIILRDHRDLGKLAGVNAQQGCHRCSHGFGTGHGSVRLLR